MDSIDEDFTRLYREFGRVFGADDQVALIFATLYLEPEEIAMEELAKETGYSLATISNKVKSLEDLGILKKSRKPGSKKIYLSAEKDLIKLVRQKLYLHENMLSAMANEKLPAMIKRHKKPGMQEKAAKKIRLLESYLDQVKRLHQLLKEMRKGIGN